MYETQVRCQHKLHQIRINERGQLIFCDHQESADTLILAAQAAKIAGRNLIRCGDIVEAWRTCERDRLPSALREAFDAGWKRSQQRRERRLRGWPTLTPHERLVERTRKAVYEALDSASYRRSQDRWVGGEHSIAINVISSGGRVKATGGKEKVWDYPKRTWPGSNSCLEVWIRRNWLFRVQRTGLALIDGIFVLDVVGKERNRTLVVAVRQGRGFDVSAAPATVRAYAGQLKLVWSR